jgi:hypothetical protein
VFGSKSLGLVTEPCYFLLGDHAQATDNTDLAGGGGPPKIVEGIAEFSVFFLDEPIYVDITLVFTPLVIGKLLYDLLVHLCAITLEPDWA